MGNCCDGADYLKAGIFGEKARIGFFNILVVYHILI
jgi:hypothetical protein